MSQGSLGNVRKLVISNRGEIARRILRTGRDRGYRVAVISTPDDRDAPVRQEADDVLEVPSFLDGAAIVKAAKDYGADVIHPGYGFLSENSEFAARVEEAGIAYCGPEKESMERMGNKEHAKQLANELGVPTLESVRSDQLDAVSSLGDPPFLVKAAGGGGGRGMRVVHDASKLEEVLARASEEAAAGFGDPTVFIERFVAEPRHIELQVLGDGEGGGIALGERECSMQRRFQKVIEEAPSPVVSPELRERMSRSALELVRATRYRGVGTVEFLLDEDDNFYFLEVNTRLQVEHPVTELVYGVDLVAAQLEVAEGGWPVGIEDASPSGWAIEARVLAEDPRADFLPTPGPLHRYREPALAGVRVDSGVVEGGRVHSGFDSMIAKVIASGASRAEACRRLSRALETMVVHGATTNLPFLQSLVRHPDFHSASFSTTWIAEHLDELNRSLLPDALAERMEGSGFREQLRIALHGGSERTRAARRFERLDRRFTRVFSARERGAIRVDGATSDGTVTLSGPGLAEALTAEPASNPRFSESLVRDAVAAEHQPERLSAESVATVLDASSLAMTLYGETVVLEDPWAATERRVRTSSSDGEVHAPMAGKVLEVRVEAGAAVEEGEVLAVVESMKMQLEVRAPLAGTVAEVHAEAGSVLDGPDLLVVLEP